jgi:hypothetical protein
MARDAIEKQSAESKKRDRKYKDIIKNGEFSLMICFELEGKRREASRRSFGGWRLNVHQPRLEQKYEEVICLFAFVSLSIPS